MLTEARCAYASSSSGKVNDLCVYDGDNALACAMEGGNVDCLQLVRGELARVRRVTPSSGKGRRDGGPAPACPAPAAAQRRPHAGGSTSEAPSVRAGRKGEGAIMKLSPVPGRPDLLIYTTQAGFIHLLDLRSEKEAWVFKRRPHTGVNSALVVGQDGKWLASATNRGYVTVRRLLLISYQDYHISLSS